MAVIIINPNSTASMTEAMVAGARVAAPDMEFEGWTSDDGPPAIQGEADGDAATPPLLELVSRASKQGADGIVIGCFDDTGLREAAKLADCPVIGIGQASYHYAAIRQWRFSVVTTLSVSVPVLEKNILETGLRNYVGRVRASEVPVLELEHAPEKAAQMVLEEARLAEAEDDISALVLGCAGMVQVVEAVRKGVSVSVIDPVVCAVHAMRWLAA